MYLEDVYVKREYRGKTTIFCIRESFMMYRTMTLLPQDRGVKLILAQGPYRT